MNNKKILGIVMVLAGLLLLFQFTGQISIGNIISTWWPIILILIGANQLLSSNGQSTGGIVLIALGGIFLIDRLNLLRNTSVWSLMLPAIIIFAGISYINGSRHGNWKDEEGNIRSGNPNDSVSGIAIFSGNKVFSTSKNFKHASGIALFGGIDIDLRDADIAPGSTAKVDVTALFGGADVFIPPHWNVQYSGLPLFGGFDVKACNSSANDSNAPTLIVNYLVVFGGVDVKNRK